MANELQGIFSGIASGLNTVASKSANEEYVKSQEINRALDYLKLNKDLDNDLKQSARNDYNHEQNIINNTNRNANVHTTGILDQAKAEFANPNLNKEQITNIKNSLENKLNDFNYTKSSSIYKETVLASLDALTNNKIDDLKVEKSINDLGSSLAALYKKNRRVGNYAGDKDGFYAQLDNANNLLKNESDRLVDTQAARVKSFIDNITKTEYIRSSLESYDVDPNKGFLQLGKKIGDAEAFAIQEVDKLYRNGRIDDAYTKLGSILNQKSSDRTTISNQFKSGKTFIDKGIHGYIKTNQNEIKKFDENIPKNAMMLYTTMNNAQSVNSSQTSDGEFNSIAFYRAVDEDLDEWLSNFLSDKKEKMWEPAKALVEEMSDLDNEGRTLYLAARIRKVDDNYYWNDTENTPYKLNTKIVNSPSQFAINNSKISQEKINLSTNNLVNLLDLKTSYKNRFAKNKPKKAFYSEKLALFQKFSKLYDISQQNPNHKNNLNRDKNLEAVRGDIKSNNQTKYSAMIVNLEDEYENLSLVPDKKIKETLEGLDKNEKDDFLDYLYNKQTAGGQNAR